MSGLDSIFCSSIMRTQAPSQHHPDKSRSCLLCRRCLQGCQTSPRSAKPLGNTVTSCEVWLVCGCGNSPVWFETGMSHIVLPTDRGLLKNLLWEKLIQSQPFFQQLALHVQTLVSSSVFLLSLHSTGTWLALRRHSLNNHTTVTHALPKTAWLRHIKHESQ